MPWYSCGVTVMTMLQYAISVLQMISPAIKVFGYFSCSQSCHAVEQIFKRTMIWHAMALVWSHCNDNTAKCNFGITNDCVSIKRVFMFPLLLARICRSTNNRVDGDFTIHLAHNASKRDFSITNNFVPNQGVWIFFCSCFCSQSWHAVKQLSSGWWFRTPWSSCVVTVMTMLQNAISQTHALDGDSH